MIQKNTALSLATITLASFFIAACGGGGGSTSPAPRTPPPVTQPPTSNTPTWTQGVYQPSSQFAARCETPRTGTDPFTGTAYPDRAGSALEEKLWQRSFTDETYLWFDEVPDNNPNDFSILGYFDQLKTEELTASGRPKDNFHFTQPTEEYNERTQSGTSSGYGFNWEFVASRAPRELIVRYTETGSPADLANIPRGASLRTVNGIDFVNTEEQSDIDALNDALFFSERGDENTFVFELADGSTLSATLRSDTINLTPVQNTSIIDTASAKVGYFQFNTFITPAQDDLIAAFEEFVESGVSELVIDLRYNGGGALALASQIGYMIAGPNQTNNAVFERLRFNSKRQQPDPIPFYGVEIDYVSGFLTNTPLPAGAFSRIVVLTTDNSCSASEALINSMRGIDIEVIQIGSTTCGKPYGFVPEDNCGTTYFTIQSQGLNNKGFGEYANGFSPVASPIFDDQLPGCTVDDDLNHPLGSSEEAMLASALQYLEDGSCPAPSAAPDSIQRLIDNTDSGKGPKIHTPNRFLESIINEDRTPIGKG